MYGRKAARFVSSILLVLVVFLTGSGLSQATVIIPDASGNGNDISFNGTPAFTSACTGQALSVDGTYPTPYHYGTVPAAANQIIQDLTVEGFINWTGPGTPAPTQNSWVIVDKFTQSSDPGRSWSLNIKYPTDQLQVEVRYNSSNAYVVATDPDPLPTGVWTHVAFTASTDSIRLYVNGVQKAAADFIGRDINYAQNTWIGFANAQNLAAAYIGMLDEFRISNTVRTSFPSTCSPLPLDANTIALWHFGGCPGTTLDVPGSYSTIQAAIDAACSGDTILVADGKYTGPGNREILLNPDGGNRDLVIMSVGGASVCTLDVAGSAVDPARGFRVSDGESSATVIQGFTILNGYTDYGAGIYISGGSSPQIIDCVISGSHATQTGGGLLIDSSNPSFIGCVFKQNSSDLGGAGVYVGVNSTPSFTGCTVEGNTAATNGGGIYCYQSSPNLTLCSLVGNTANGDAGGGIFLDGPCSLVASEVVLAHNTATLRGGAVYSGNTATAEFTNCTFFNDSAPTGSGTIETQNQVTLVNSIVAFTIGGEAIHFDGGSATLSYSNLFGNAGGDWTTGIATQLGTSGNISADPRFSYQCPCFTGTAISDSLHLCYDSPCIDTGDPVLVDPDGSASDMGTYWYNAGKTAWARYLTIIDIPNDQGRKARLSWTGSVFDGAGCVGDSFTVTEYAVYRRQDALPNQGWPPKAAWPLGDWDHVADVPALGESNYSTVVPTLIDSIAGRDTVSAYSTFFVAARTPDPLTSFYSLPASGFSVDNLPPAVPGGLKAKAEPNAIRFTWDQNWENDFREYAIFEGDLSAWTDTSAATRIATIGDRSSVERVVTVSSWGEHQYAIGAFDVNGNWSGLSDLQIVTGVGGGNVPRTYALDGNTPNPFNPTTTIRFAVPAEGLVKITIHDVRGRAIRMLLSKTMMSGEHEIVWNGKDDSAKDVVSGVYFARMTAEGFSATKKMVLMK